MTLNFQHYCCKAYICKYTQSSCTVNIQVHMDHSEDSERDRKTVEYTECILHYPPSLCLVEQGQKSWSASHWAGLSRQAGWWAQALQGRGISSAHTEFHKLCRSLPDLKREDDKSDRWRDLTEEVMRSPCTYIHAKTPTCTCTCIVQGIVCK